MGSGCDVLLRSAFCFSSEFGHIVEIYNFSSDLKTQDIMQSLNSFRFLIFFYSCIS